MDNVCVTSRRYAQRWPVPPPTSPGHASNTPQVQPSLMLDSNASIVRHRSPHISTTRVGPARRPGPTATRGRHMCLTRMDGSW
eukprot:6140103-Prymnesium_polylepis.1